MGWFNRLKAGHHYTMIGVKAKLEHDEAEKKLNELRTIISGLEESKAEGDRLVSPDPRTNQILSALKRTVASYKETYSAYEGAVRACQAVSESVDAACNNYDFEFVDVAWTKATGAVFSAKAAAAQAISVHSEMKRAIYALATPS